MVINFGLRKRAAGEPDESRWVRKCCRANGHGRITEFISPEGVEELIAAEILLTAEQVKQRSAPLGWCSATDLKKDGYVGNTETLRSKIVAVALEKRISYLAEGKTAKEADALVREKWVRRCRIAGLTRVTEFVSPEGIKELTEKWDLLTLEQAQRLIMPHGWRSANDLKRHYIGDSAKLRAHIIAFAAAKMAAYLAEGKTAKEAEALVKEKWVRKGYSNKKPPTTELISPEGIQELIVSGALITPAQAGVMPFVAGWRSNFDLTENYKGGYEDLRKKIIAFAAAKMAAYLAEGKTAEEAEALVKEKWVRKCYSCFNQAIIINFISPEAIEEMIKQGLLKPRIVNLVLQQPLVAATSADQEGLVREKKTTPQGASLLGAAIYQHWRGCLLR
ncbi:MAG: hypothetical protein AB7G80_03695 [Dongiaceae bacterium]